MLICSTLPVFPFIPKSFELLCWNSLFFTQHLLFCYNFPERTTANSFCWNAVYKLCRDTNVRPLPDWANNFNGLYSKIVNFSKHSAEISTVMIGFCLIYRTYLNFWYLKTKCFWGFHCALNSMDSLFLGPCLLHLNFRIDVL